MFSPLLLVCCLIASLLCDILEKEIIVRPMEEITTNTTQKAANTCSSALTNNNNNNSSTKPQPSTSLERKVRPQKDQALNCPRCNSTNTKFCYYNNYSLTQPRYFCKGCRRYWTEGGSLRKIPVGGGTRKNKRPSSSITSPSATKIELPDLVVRSNCTNPNPKIHETQDLNLGFPSTFSEFMQLPIKNAYVNQTTNASSNMSHFSAMGLAPFMPMQIPDPNSVFQAGFPLQGDLKQSLNFSLNGIGSGGGLGLQGAQESGGNSGRIFFPFEDLKSTTTTATTITTTPSKTADDHHQNHSTDQHVTRDQYGDSTGYWTRILGGAGSW